MLERFYEGEGGPAVGVALMVRGEASGGAGCGHCIDIAIEEAAEEDLAAGVEALDSYPYRPAGYCG